MENNLLNAFDELDTDQSITIDQLDLQVQDMATAKSRYDEMKAQSNMLHADYQEQQAKLITIMRALKKSKYFVDGIGTVSVGEKLKVKTPQTLEAKELLFNHLTAVLGHEGFVASASINYMTLQRIYNEEFDKAKEAGTASEFSMPGLDQPQAEFNLKFTKR